MEGGLLHVLCVGEVDVLVAVVVDGVLVYDALAAVFFKGDVVVESPLHPSLDGLGEFEGTQSLHLA